MAIDDDTIPLTLRELKAGVLLGRSDRCQTHNKLAESDDVSRVHLLLWWDSHDQTLWAIDTASTNGTIILTKKDDSFLKRAHPLTEKTDFLLAQENFTWTPKHKRMTSPKNLH